MTQTEQEYAEQLHALLQPRILDEYAVHVPHPAQQVALALPAKEMLFGGAAGGGKLFSLTNYLLTTEGWKLGSEIEVGDYVYAQDGSPTRVLAQSEIVNHGTYRVTMDDGEQIDVHEQHLWNVSNQRQRDNYARTCPDFQAKRRASRESRAKTSKTPAMAGAGIGKGQSYGTTQALTLSNHKRAEAARDTYVRPSIWDYTSTVTTLQLKEMVESADRKISIPVGGAIQGTLPWQSDIPPYTLGAWLGDGDSRNGYIYVAADDYEALTDELLADGWNTEVKWTTKNRKQPFGRLKLTNSRGETLQHVLVREGFGAKHIPEWVVRTSFADRQALLGGILDTDGHVDTRGRIQFAMAREGLVRSTHEVFWSIGVAPTQVKHKKTKNQTEGFSGDAWIFDVSACPDYLFRFPRKRDVLREATKGKRNYKEHRYIVSVTKVDDVPMQCIQVENTRGLFRIGRTGLVTHNSDFLLMAALRYVDVPGYSAILFRRTYKQLIESGAILDRFKSWMAGKNVKKEERGMTWVFPSGAKIRFGHIHREADKYNYQGAEFQFIGFDEATMFEPDIYTWAFSRLRKPTVSCNYCSLPLTRAGANFIHLASQKEACNTPMPDERVLSQYTPAERDGMTVFDLPLQVIATANPGGLSHEFFKERFVDPANPDVHDEEEIEQRKQRAYIPSTIRDNPSLNQEEYMATLQNLSMVDRERYLNGDWEILEEGNLFKASDFQYVERGPSPDDIKSRVRFWDFAASDGQHSDWTAGALCSITKDGKWFIEDMKRVRALPPDVEKLVKKTAQEDGIGVRVYSEQEPGSSGKALVSYYKRHVLAGWRYDGVRSTGNKTDRAGSLVSQTEGKNVYLVKAAWNKAFTTEASLFPVGAHDDQVDAAAGAFVAMTVNAKRKVRLVTRYN